MSGRTIPASVIEVAAELVGLFDRERELALARAIACSGDDQLTAGLSAEALRASYGPTGPDLGSSGRKPPVSGAGEVAGLAQVKWQSPQAARRRAVSGSANGTLRRFRVLT